MLNKGNSQDQKLGDGSSATQAGRDVVQNITNHNHYGLSETDVEQKIDAKLSSVLENVNTKLEPIFQKIWDVEQLKVYIENEVIKKLQDEPPHKIVVPPPNVVIPALESLRFSGNIDELREMFTNLIASSMKSDITHDAHPAFVEIIKQLTAKEAVFLKLISSQKLLPLISLNREFDSGGHLIEIRHYSSLGGEYNIQPHDIAKFIDNLSRLGLINVPEGMHYTSEGVYDALENSDYILKRSKAIELAPGSKARIKRQFIEITDFGKQFIEICIKAEEKVITVFSANDLGLT